MLARELRFALTFDDYDSALRLFRDVLGLETVEVLDQPGGRGIILRVPSATLELFDRDYGALVDEVEVGRALQQRVRIAVRIDDLERAGQAIAATGARPEAEPVDTPWGDRNRRYRTADGLQMTLFEHRASAD
jgi:lactoylglutathione lyase